MEFCRKFHGIRIPAQCGYDQNKNWNLIDLVVRHRLFSRILYAMLAFSLPDFAGVCGNLSQMK